MQKQATRDSSLDAASTRSPNPQWWGEKHTSTWDRVKEALHRDWEQTKADFSSKDAADLNQDVGDTVKQATGAAPIPPPLVKTHPDDPKDAAKAVEKEIKEIGKAQQKITAAQTDVAVEQVRAQASVASAQQKASEKVAEVQHKATEKVVEAQQKASEKVVDAQQKASEKIAEARDWNRVEPAVRYGYGARSQYADSPVWNDQLEGRLRTEWTAMKNGSTWDDMRDHVRHGWDSASRNSVV